MYRFNNSVGCENSKYPPLIPIVPIDSGNFILQENHVTVLAISIC